MTFLLINSFALTLSSLFLSVEWLRFFHYTIAITKDIAPPLRRALATRLPTQSHPFSVQLSDPRLNRYAQSYMKSTGKVWNTLPSSIFPTSYDLHTFKHRVSGHVGL